MHPAGSLIYFTVASGFGFGFLFFLGLGMPETTGAGAFWRYFVGYGLAVTGLMSSVLHLGNPVNAWKAFSQWRSSWLSREGVVSIAALLALAPVALTQIFGGPDLGWLGILGAVLSLATIYCTSMIYGQLGTVPRWNQPLTPILFLAMGFAGGALLAQQSTLALIGLAVASLIQLAHWRLGDRAWTQGADTMESATGLGGADGKVRLLERPHTGKNYLTTEMVHMVGRKHAQRLRGFVMALLLLPILGLLFMPAVSAGGLWMLAVPMTLAALMSRWLFFAEAEHVVGLYYGRQKS